MDVFQSVQGYVTKIITQGESAATDGGAAKMKILLLDKDTVSQGHGVVDSLQHADIVLARSQLYHPQQHSPHSSITPSTSQTASMTRIARRCAIYGVSASSDPLQIVYNFSSMSSGSHDMVNTTYVRSHPLPRQSRRTTSD